MFEHDGLGELGINFGTTNVKAFMENQSTTQAAKTKADADTAAQISAAKAKVGIITKTLTDLKSLNVSSIKSLEPEPEYHDSNGVVITKAQYDALMSGQPIYKDENGNIIAKAQYDDIMNNPTYEYYDAKGNKITKDQYDAAVSASKSKSGMTTDQMNQSITAMNDVRSSKIYYGTTPPYPAPSGYQWNHIGIGTRSEGFRLSNTIAPGI